MAKRSEPSSVSWNELISSDTDSGGLHCANAHLWSLGWRRLPFFYVYFYMGLLTLLLL